MHLIPLVAAAVTLAAQTPTFDTVHKIQGQAHIAFVHVETEVPALRLGVYSDREQLASWSPQASSQGQPVLIQLEPNQDFTIDPHGNLLGISEFDYECMEDESASGLAQSTALSFPKPFAQQLRPPWTPPADAIVPPPAVPGARFVHVGSQARLIAFAARGLEDGRPLEVQIFRRVQPQDVVFTATGSYTNVGFGELQSSLSGGLLAQVEGGELRLIAPSGTEIVRFERSGPFQLSGNGQWLANCSADSVLFIRLGDNGAPSGQTFTVPTESAAYAVRFLGDQAVILERQKVSFVTLTGGSAGEAVPVHSGKQGSFTSAELVPLGQGRIGVAAGRLEVKRAPARQGGQFVPGLAIAYADVIVLPGGIPLESCSTTIELTRWNFDMPRVRFVGQSPRMLVVTSQVVMLSPEVQLP